MSKFSEFVRRLIQIVNITNLKCRLKPEAALQKAFVDNLVYWTLEGRLKCVWTSIANENGSNDKPLYGMVLRALGKVRGAPDMVFLWDSGSGFIEFKAGKNKQTMQQRIFADWCKVCNVNYEVCYTPEEAKNTLKKWGVFKEF